MLQPLSLGAIYISRRNYICQETQSCAWWNKTEKIDELCTKLPSLALSTAPAPACPGLPFEAPSNSRMQERCIVKSSINISSLYFNQEDKMRFKQLVERTRNAAHYLAKAQQGKISKNHTHNFFFNLKCKWSIFYINWTAWCLHDIQLFKHTWW